MNREILFRGKRVDNGEWVYGNLLYENMSDRYYIDLSINIREDDYCKLYVYAVEVIPETIGQYTGLTDNTGKKIFEGDIVFYSDFTSVYKNDITGVVKYTQDCMFEIEYDDEYIKDKKETRPLVCHEHSIFASKKTEVIGNIHDGGNK